jgi:hypothetical protein
MNLLGLLLKIRSFQADKFEKMTKYPMAAQRNFLLRMLYDNRDTVFGKEHGFAGIRSVEDYQKAVPTANYEGLRPYIKRMMDGENNVLLRDKVIFYGITSGTTNVPKYVPVTKRSRRQKKAVMDLWLYYALRDHPNALDGKALVIMSQAVEGYAPSGVPFGSESGDAYRNMPGFVSKQYALPYEVFCIKDYEARYYSILRIGIGSDVANVGTMNPLTILVLCQKIDKYATDIIDDIARGTLKASLEIEPELRAAIEKRLKPDPDRAAFLQKLLIEKGALLPMDFWPKITLLECWTGGTVGSYLKEVVKYFPDDICVRDFGFVATEGRCSIPISDNGPSGILTVGSNFYEFVPEEDREKPCPRYLTCDKLEKGKRYYIIFSTTSGLYRYDIDDIIHVMGFYNSTPVIEFVQKGKNVSSATGEKLYESQVISAINKAKDLAGVNVEFFCCCLECGIPPAYSFLVEFSHEPDVAKKRDFLSHVEASLGDINIEYKAKRSSQRLGRPKLKVLERGSFENFRKARLAVLRHDSQFKASHLRSDFKIPDEFRIKEEIAL